MTDSQRDIFWITLDSMRADHTSLNGYKRKTTPELEAIAEADDGLNFRHCIAHGNRTPVSVTSMMTGMYPTRHQIAISRGKDVGKIPRSVRLVPELFGECGYDTIAVSENSYLQVVGVDEAFDEYHRVPRNIDDFLTYPEILSLLNYLGNIREHGPGLTLQTSQHGEQTSFFTSTITKRVLRQRSSSNPLFCYLHYNDTHRPYLPPASHVSRYLEDSDVGPKKALSTARYVHENAYKLIADGLPLSEKEWDAVHAMYDAVIAYVDHCVGDIVSFLRDRFEDPIIVVTADHGDLLGERGLLGHHISVHDAVFNVPLVVAGLPQLKHATGHPVQHVDVMQTLLSMAGGDISQFQGIDLRRKKRDAAIAQTYRGSVADNSQENYGRIKQYNDSFDDSHLHQSLLTAARTTKHKLLHTEEWTRLYQLPDETTDIKETEPEIHDDLLDYVENRLESDGSLLNEAPDSVSISEDVEQHLEEMGYLE